MTNVGREGVVIFGSDEQRNVVERITHDFERSGVTVYTRFDVGSLSDGSSPAYNQARSRLEERFPKQTDDLPESIVTCALAAEMGHAAAALLVNVVPEPVLVRLPGKRKYRFFGPRLRSHTWAWESSSPGLILAREAFLLGEAVRHRPDLAIFAMLAPDLGGIESTVTAKDYTVLDADGSGHPALVKVMEAARAKS